MRSPTTTRLLTVCAKKDVKKKAKAEVADAPGKPQPAAPRLLPNAIPGVSFKQHYAWVQIKKARTDGVLVHLLCLAPTSGKRSLLGFALKAIFRFRAGPGERVGNRDGVARSVTPNTASEGCSRSIERGVGRGAKRTRACEGEGKSRTARKGPGRGVRGGEGRFPKALMLDFAPDVLATFSVALAVATQSCVPAVTSQRQPRVESRRKPSPCTRPPASFSLPPHALESRVYRRRILKSTVILVDAYNLMHVYKPTKELIEQERLDEARRVGVDYLKGHAGWMGGCKRTDTRCGLRAPPHRWRLCLPDASTSFLISHVSATVPCRECVFLSNVP